MLLTVPARQGDPSAVAMPATILMVRAVEVVAGAHHGRQSTAGYDARKYSSLEVDRIERAEA
jgi:hypothetical protein